MGGLAALGITGAGAPCASFAARELPLGLQMFSLDAQMQRDPAGTLREVGALGYRDVELVGYYGMEPAALRALLDTSALHCTSIHIRPHGPSGALPGLAADPELHFQRARALGVKYLVCPGPWFPDAVASRLPTAGLGIADIVAAVERMTDEQWRQSADLVNRCAAQARRQGLQLLYHNGNLEFAPTASGTGFATLLRHFDSEVVKFELDCGWIMAAGHNPLDYLKNLAGRVPLIHIKDMLETPANHQMLLNPAQIGEGIVNWPEVFDAAIAAGVQRAFIEQEAPFARPAMQYARNNLKFLRKIR